MQLRQAEPLGVLDQHHRRVRHVHAHLDYRCGHQYLGLVAHKAAHLPVLGFGRHLSVHHAHFPFREKPDEPFTALLDAFQVKFFILLYQRIDHIDLTAGLEFVGDQTINLHPVVLVSQARVNRFAARRQFIDHRHVKIAVKGHGQRARYRRRRHDQNMRSRCPLAPHPGTLSHAESVLFIDHGDTELMELDLLLQQSMRADQNVDLTVFERRMQLPARLGAGASRQQFDAHTYLLAPAA